LRRAVCGECGRQWKWEEAVENWRHIPGSLQVSLAQGL
jgi:hypothetical protein